jgi:flagellar protein FliO/FliZ
MLTNSLHRYIQALLLALCPFHAMADESTDNMSSTAVRSAAIGAENLNSGYLVQLILGLIFVLVCILALAWLTKRINRFQSSTDGSLQVLGGISMGARERVVLVQVGSTQLLLGVAPGRINMLHQLEQPLEKTDSSVQGRGVMPFSKGFAETLSATLSRNK